MLDRDAILAAVDLPALADQLAGRRPSPTGPPGWPCPDPDHAPTAGQPGNVTIYLTRRGEQRWHCEGCGSGGTAVDFVMKARQTGVRDALVYLDEHSRASPEPSSLAGSVPSADAIPARTGLDAWVARAADLLWQPYGEPVRTWLTRRRRIPGDVLRANRIGATAVSVDRALPTRRGVAVARASALTAVLPVVAKDKAIYAQLRVISPRPGRPKYLNPSPPAPGAPRLPRLGLYRPVRRQHEEILVTNGIIDALSANAAGYRAAAILSPALADAEVAVHLSRLHGPLVLALDPTGPGDEAADRLMLHLEAQGRRPLMFPALDGDLNDALVAAHDWPRKLAAHIHHLNATNPPDLFPAR